MSNISKSGAGLRFDKPVDITKYPVEPPIFLQEKAVTRRPFYPLLRVTKRSRKKKRRGRKSRIICYASHQETLVFSWYAYILSYFYEKEISASPLNDSVIGYRCLNGKDTIDLASGFFRRLADGKVWRVFAIDVKDFYGSLDHARVKDTWCRLLNTERLSPDQYAVFSSVTDARVLNKNSIQEAMRKEGVKPPKGILCTIGDAKRLLEKKRLHWTSHTKDVRRGKGIPQGLAISPVLSNAFMYSFDLVVSAMTKKRGGHYLRYADDVIVAIPEDTAKDLNVVEYLEEQLRKVDLELSEGKTQERTIQYRDGRFSILNEKGEEDELDYLGLVFSSKGVCVRKKTITKFGHRVRRVAYAISFGYRSKRSGIRAVRLKVREPNYILRVDRKIDNLGGLIEKSENNKRTAHRARSKILNALLKN